MAGRIVYFSVLCSIFSHLIIKDVAAQQKEPHERIVESPVTLTSVNVQTNVDGKYSIGVTVSYIAIKPVQVLWTIDGGFSPTDLDRSASVTSTETGTRLLLPSSLQFEALHVQIVCTQELFELHIDFDKSRLSNGTFPIQPYTFYVPPKNEIGLSSTGESQFHVFVNLTGTTFSFGMITAEVSGKKHRSKGNRLYTHSAFSFLPDITNEKLRLRKIMTTSSEQHYDVLLRVPALYRSGGILSLLAACTLSNSVIKRMDMKQTIHLHPKSKPVLPVNFIGIAEINEEKTIKVKKSGKTFIRCKAIGNPSPSIELMKPNSDSSTSNSVVSVQVPTYVTSLPFEMTKTFQFVNVTASDYGPYVCKAGNGLQSIYKKYLLSEL